MSLFCKRDVAFAKEMSLLQKRCRFCKRDVAFAKEMSLLQKRRRFCKRDVAFLQNDLAIERAEWQHPLLVRNGILVCLFVHQKETYVSMSKETYVFMSKETYVSMSKKTYVYKCMSQETYVCVSILLVRNGVWICLFLHKRRQNWALLRKIEAHLWHHPFLVGQGAIFRVSFAKKIGAHKWEFNHESPRAKIGLLGNREAVSKRS